jgi:hypothetical protein
MGRVKALGLVVVVVGVEALETELGHGASPGPGLGSAPDDIAPGAGTTSRRPSERSASRAPVAFVEPYVG